ncbi:choice-of-anchor I family protein [Bordetella petrii]|uniref:choice-of-anchor I family protein n=1 Tax=Bordetella petrii TaxID=94624 RepID=UPI001A978000|nr:choice-of-anchor I family protein [Bordetella petrii]MBO1110590.1 choice-of-anchor I family protein [Bordetella petrii]
MKNWKLAAASAMLPLLLAACGSGSDDDDEQSPSPAAEASQHIASVDFIGRYESGSYGVSAAEIPAYDPATRRAFVVNALSGKIDVLDLSTPASPAHIGTLDAEAVSAGAEINSVAVRSGMVAVAIQAAVKTDTGHVALYDAASLALLGSVPVGALPDMLTFTPDGKTVLVANEGEPSDDYTVDPQGSVSVIDVSDPAAPTARTADFTRWNGQESALRAQGVRLVGPRASAAQDIEPEYIAVADDGATAWVTLQENNALARLDVAGARITDILPLGAKDHGADGNGLDVSDADGAIAIRTWPGVKGLYMPDAIAAYTAGGATYLVTANEGDGRAWGENNPAYWDWGRDAGGAWLGLDASLAPGFVDEFRVKHLVHKDGFDRRAGDDLPPQLRQLAPGGLLDPAVFGYCGATATDPGDCRDDEQLGRLTVTWTMGYKQNADGTPQLSADGRLVYDTLYAYGARSFSIRDADGRLVWDSGDQFERITAERYPDWFNSGHDETLFDDRSDNKGPEPEGIALGKIGARTYAFVGLERMGGIMVYDITDPAAPAFTAYVNSRDLTVDSAVDPAAAGDLGPEGLAFVSAADSPNGEPLLIVGNEVSGTTAIYRIVLADDAS